MSTDYHGPSLDCGCGWGRLCDFHANGSASVHPTHNGYCWATWQGVGVSVHGRDGIEYARMDTGMVHGPADVTVDDYARFSYYAVRASDLRMSNARELARATDIIQRRLIAPR